jgi:tubulin polyglutamylase TTLL1
MQRLLVGLRRNGERLRCQSDTFQGNRRNSAILGSNGLLCGSKLSRSSEFVFVAQRAVSSQPKAKKSSLKSIVVSQTLMQKPKLKLIKFGAEKSDLKFAFSGPYRKCLFSNFEKRGWTETKIKSWDWNLVWYSLGLYGLFQYVPIERLKPNQFINHFPKHREITHKDRLYDNITTYKKKLLVKKPQLAEELDFLPKTYLLPKEKDLVKNIFKSSPVWILKPSSRARGNGIQIVTDWTALNTHLEKNSQSYSRFVLSKYIDNPLLLAGRKFDIRLYVFVRSFQPLIAYIYKEGFARMSNVPYTTEKRHAENLQVHLTNIAVQKKFSNVQESKVLLTDLQMIMEQQVGKRTTTNLFNQIRKIVLHSLMSCQGLVDWNPQCFELFGYDILVDQNFKPWLIEVNASPSMGTTSETDHQLKTCLVNDLLNIVIPPHIHLNKPLDEPYGIITSPYLGNFELLVDETKPKSKRKC